MEQELEDSFEKEMGSPTLTLILKQEERMIPWASFVSARYRDARIELQFQGWEVVIAGRNLKRLWESCQLQDVRWLRAVEKEIADQLVDDCSVTDLHVKVVED